MIRDYSQDVRAFEVFLFFDETDIHRLLTSGQHGGHSFSDNPPFPVQIVIPEGMGKAAEKGQDLCGNHIYTDRH